MEAGKLQEQHVSFFFRLFTNKSLKLKSANQLNCFDRKSIKLLLEIITKITIPLIDSKRLIHKLDKNGWSRLIHTKDVDGDGLNGLSLGVWPSLTLLHHPPCLLDATSS